MLSSSAASSISRTASTARCARRFSSAPRFTRACCPCRWPRRSRRRSEYFGVMTRAPLDLIDVDHLHSDEELEIRRVVRKLVDERVRQHVAEWDGAGNHPGRRLYTGCG